MRCLSDSGVTCVIVIPSVFLLIAEHILKGVCRLPVSSMQRDDRALLAWRAIC